MRLKARMAEVRLIEALVRGGMGRNAGVIGISSRERLKRLPSTIYWLGLRTFGIRRFDGSIEQYHRSADAFNLRTRAALRSDDREYLHGAPPANWHSGLPPPPDDLLVRSTFDLSSPEAEYLQERIVTTVPDSLLAFLAGHGRVAGLDFPWDRQGLPAQLDRKVRHAQKFSEVMHGAVLLYNLMLAELSVQEDRIDDYQKLLRRWRATIRAQRRELNQWDLGELWMTASTSAIRVPGPTRRFTQDWLKITRSTNGAVVRSQLARDLIHARELHVKRGQARLINAEARAQWSGASAVDQLSYRWPTAVRMLEDIQRGLSARRLSGAGRAGA
jgi:hypothetical protein